MDSHIYHTLKKTNGVFTIKLTQKLSDYNVGHWNWVILNMFGDVELAGYSSGHVRKKATTKDLDEIFERWEQDR